MAEALGHIAAPVAPVRPDARPQQVASAVAVVEAKPAAPDVSAADKNGELAGQYATLDNTKLTVSLDAETGTYVYRSVAAEDGEVVWQWPSEQVMRVIQYFRRIESLEEKLAAKRAVDQKV